MYYKLLGFAVWKGARWYVRRRYGHLVPPRKALAAGLVISAVSALALVATRRAS